jgi:hypothetical protein
MPQKEGHLGSQKFHRAILGIFLSFRPASPRPDPVQAQGYPQNSPGVKAQVSGSGPVRQDASALNFLHKILAFCSTMAYLYFLFV